MLKNINDNTLRVIILSVILWGILGNPHERSENQPFIEHEDSSSPEGTTNNRDENKSPAAIRVRASFIDNYASRTKNPVIGGSKEIKSDGRITFPSDSHEHTAVQPKFEAVTACKNTTFCENPTFYPKDYIQMAIKTRQDLKFLATVDVAPEIGQRIDADNDDETLCAYEDIVVFPKTAENKAKQWLYIINEDNFPQGVRIETCMTENTACSIIEGLVDGYETSCKQKFVYRQLAAVSSNGSVGADFFRFPASCCCHIKFTGNPTTRIGIDANKASLQSPALGTIISRIGETSSITRKKNENK